MTHQRSKNFILFWSLLLVCAGCPVKESLAPDTGAQDLQPPAPRIVAIGDLHGDLAAARQALKLAGAIDSQDHWIGGSLVVIQTGDHLDRGKEDRALFDLLETLAGEARKAGGDLIVLLGNHELMNVQLDFRYIAPEAFAEFADIPFDASDPQLSALPADQRARAAAFRPGGSYALKLAQHQAVLIKEETIFVHGGLLPAFAGKVEQINQALTSWMEGKSSEPSEYTGDSGPLWDRTYGMDATAQDCQLLEQVLAATSTKRMVVGHSPHKSGIAPACDNKLWRIDTGMSAYYGGVTEALQLQDGEAKVLAE